MIDIIHDLIYADNTLCGFGPIFEYLHIKKNKRYRIELLNEYGCKYDLLLARKFLRAKQSKYEGIRRKGKKLNVSEQGKQKRAAGIRKFWSDEKNTVRCDEIRSISRHNILTYCNQPNINQTPEVKRARVKSRKENNLPWISEEGRRKKAIWRRDKIVTIETKNKMSISAIRRGYCRPVGFKHTAETKIRLSESTKRCWVTGIYKCKFKSSGHILIETILSDAGYTVESEKIVGSRPFDIFISDLNLLIEFNGTYWHKDPRIYSALSYDKSKNVYAYEIWDRDKSKNELATNLGYKLLIIWQYDLENATNQRQFVLDKIKPFLYE